MINALYCISTSHRVMLRVKDLEERPFKFHFLRKNYFFCHIYTSYTIFIQFSQSCQV